MQFGSHEFQDFQHVLNFDSNLIQQIRIEISRDQILLIPWQSMWDSKNEITMEQTFFRIIRYNSCQFSCQLTSIYRLKPFEKFHHIVG
jgi:hypothetical protein